MIYASTVTNNKDKKAVLVQETRVQRIHMPGQEKGAQIHMRECGRKTNIQTGPSPIDRYILLALIFRIICI